MNTKEKLARAMWECVEDEYSFDDAKAGGHSAYRFAIYQVEQGLPALKEPNDELIEAMQKAMWPSGELIYDDAFATAEDQFKAGVKALIEAVEAGR